VINRFQFASLFTCPVCGPPSIIMWFGRISNHYPCKKTVSAWSESDQTLIRLWSDISAREPGTKLTVSVRSRYKPEKKALWGRVIDSIHWLKKIWSSLRVLGSSVLHHPPICGVITIRYACKQKGHQNRIFHKPSYLRTRLTKFRTCLRKAFFFPDVRWYKYEIKMWMTLPNIPLPPKR